MKPFIAWSKDSRRIAHALHTFISQVNSKWAPFVSGIDVGAGEEWDKKIIEAIGGSNFGIVCAFRENLRSDWVSFEMGYLKAKCPDARICPFVIDADNSEPSGPLTKFHWIDANFDGALKLAKSLNEKSEERLQLSEADLLKKVNHAWPALESEIKSACSGRQRPARNEINLDGFRKLLSIHMTATLGTLEFEIRKNRHKYAKLIENTNLNKRKNIERVIKLFRRLFIPRIIVVLKTRRMLLEDFSCKEFGNAASFVAGQLTDERLKSLAVGIFAKAIVTDDFCESAIEHIRVEQGKFETRLSELGRR